MLNAPVLLYFIGIRETPLVQSNDTVTTEL